MMNTGSIKRLLENAIVEVEGKILKKWRPTRNEVFTYLKKSGYERVIEVNPAVFSQ